MSANKTKTVLHPNQKKYYDNNKEEVRETQKEYYDNNKKEIIEKKKIYRNKKKIANTDPNKAICSRCNVLKDNASFGINATTKKQYKHCTPCREKQKK